MLSGITEVVTRVYRFHCLLRGLYYRWMERKMLDFIVTPQLSNNKELIYYKNHFHQEFLFEQAVV
jgi:hypothetical protein